MVKRIFNKVLIFSFILTIFDTVYANMTLEALRQAHDSYFFHWQLALREISKYIVFATIIILFILIFTFAVYCIVKNRNLRRKI